MTIELKMPALSPTMEKGTLAKWLVAVGDAVKPGDLLAEIETDKATMEFEAVDEGFIAELRVSEGTDDVAVGTVIALLSDDDAGLVSEPVLVESTPSIAGPVEAPAVEPDPASEPDAAEQAQSRQQSSPADRISPLAMRIARANGINWSTMTGSGPNGRIVRADLMAASPVPKAAQSIEKPAVATLLAAAAPSVSAPPEGVPVETVTLSSMRKTIARRLAESKQTVPHFYLTVRCNIDPLLGFRSELNAAIGPRGIKLSVNDMLIKAMALALVQVPDANVQFGGTELHRFTRADISMAVAIDGGLITPIIRGADKLSLSAIAQTSKALAVKAREGKLVPTDYQGGTASISNLGMFGIDEIVPVINPPQALILGIGAGVEQPWKVNGEIALATILAATGSFDHRAIDGATAAQFMAAFKDVLDHPMLLVS